MELTNYTEIEHTSVWKEVKNWVKEDKVRLITLLSISLADSSEKAETPEEKTKRMLAKHAGNWHGSDSAEDIIRIINEGKHSSMEPINL